MDEPNLISRRRLLSGGAGMAGAVAAGAALALGASPEPAEARTRTDTTRRSYGPVAIIGDSISGGYFGGLGSALGGARVGPYRYDISGSRRIARSAGGFGSGAAAARSMIASGFAPRAWVVALGNNDFYFFRHKSTTPGAEIGALMKAVGPGRHVVFLTIWTTASTTWSTFNSGLRAAAGGSKYLHVYDWAAIARKHPDWLQSDGAHLTAAGAAARNQALARAAVQAARAAGATKG